MEQEVVTTDYGLEVGRHTNQLGMTESGLHATRKERRDEPKVKKHKTVKKVKLPVGPFVLDEDKLMDKYQDSPNHIVIIKSLPRKKMHTECRFIVPIPQKKKHGVPILP